MTDGTSCCDDVWGLATEKYTLIPETIILALAADAIFVILKAVFPMLPNRCTVFLQMCYY